MVPRIKKAKYVGGYTIWLHFADGAEGEVDLSSELVGEVFEPLKNQDFFKSFVLHNELRTAVWPNGADFAPEFLRSSIRVAA
jgi:hypothetical protein